MDKKKTILVVGGGGLGAESAERILSAQRLADKEGAELVILDESHRGPYKDVMDKLKDVTDFYAPEPFVITPRPELPDMEDIRYGHLSKKHREANIIPLRTEPKIFRNQPCPCGSKKKYKHCCGKHKK
jgi:hypothetical protein